MSKLTLPPSISGQFQNLSNQMGQFADLFLLTTNSNV